jgi:hypothetical protein
LKLRIRRPVLAAALLASVIGAFELPFASFMADDLIQLGILEGVSPNTWAGPLDLYTISDGLPEHVRRMKEAGAFPWFFDPAFKMVFFRPLSSGLLSLDHAIFGLRPIGYRAHGVLWFLLLVVGVGLVLRRALPRPVGGLALLVFTVSGIHGVLNWTATRHIVIAAALGVLALACHLRWREESWKAGAGLSVAGFAVALCASEAALGVVAYLLAYEALAGPDGWRRRVAAGFPVAGLVSLYLLFYSLLGYGVSGGSGYISPITQPLRFLVELPERMAVLLGAMAVGGGADLWVLRPDLRGVMAVSGAVAVAIVALLFRAVWRDAPREQTRGVGWLAVGAVASAVAFAGTPIGSRCLVVPFVGGSAVMAFVLHRWWTTLGRLTGLKWRVIAVGCALLAGIHLVVAPLQRLASPLLLRQMMHDQLARAMREAELDDGRLERRRVVLLASPTIVVGFHAFFYRTLYRLPMPASWRSLSWAPCEHRFIRTAPDKIEMSLAGCEMEAPHLMRNQVLALQDMGATVLEVGPRGPTRVDFRFDRSLDDPSFVFLGWRDGRLLRLRPPPIGQALVLLPPC